MSKKVTEPEIIRTVACFHVEEVSTEVTRVVARYRPLGPDPKKVYVTMIDDSDKALESFVQQLREAPIDTKSRIEAIRERDVDIIEKTKAYLIRLAEAATREVGAKWEVKSGSPAFDVSRDMTRLTVFPGKDGFQKAPFAITFTTNHLTIEAAEIVTRARTEVDLYSALTTAFVKYVKS